MYAWMCVCTMYVLIKECIYVYMYVRLLVRVYVLIDECMDMYMFVRIIDIYISVSLHISVFISVHRRIGIFPSCYPFLKIHLHILIAPSDLNRFSPLLPSVLHHVRSLITARPPHRVLPALPYILSLTLYSSV